MSDHYGEFMALAAAFVFSWTSVFFTEAGRRLGVTIVNLFRLPGAAACLALTHRVLTGHWWPPDLAVADHAWIGLSGIVGLAIGDSALFRAFTTIGPRRSMTLMALAPVFTVIVAWFTLGERLGPAALAGIGLIIGGVVAANAGKVGTGTFAIIETRVFRIGVLLALVGSLGQGLGSVFAKLGMVGSSGGPGIDPLGATLVRLSWATIAYWLVVAPRQRVTDIRTRLQDRRGVVALVVAILMGPYISVWMSLVAIRNTDAGVAQVLLGMVPIFVVLPAWIIYKDRPTALSMVGIVTAVAGGALLFLR